jgi:hypothetical protein
LSGRPSIRFLNRKIRRSGIGVRDEGGSGAGPPEKGLAVGVVMAYVVDTRRATERNHR